MQNRTINSGNWMEWIGETLAAVILLVAAVLGLLHHPATMVAVELCEEVEDLLTLWEELDIRLPFIPLWLKWQCLPQLSMTV